MPGSWGSGKYKKTDYTGETMHRVPGEGPLNADIMLIGERPGPEEGLVARPFVGPAGKLLDTALEMAGIDRNKIYVTNVVKTMVWDKGKVNGKPAKPTAAEIERDTPHLLLEIDRIQPKVIGALGTYATEWLLGVDRALLDRNHGIPFTTLRPELSDIGAICVPCYHPASGLYTSETLALTFSDLRRVALLASGDLTPAKDIFPNPNYEECSTDLEVDADVAVDTEGSRERPWCLTFSYTPGMATMLRPPRSARFGGRVFLHNSLHDLAVLRAMGVELEDGQFTDTMVLAYLLCLEPQSLKTLAWRHAGMEMMEYDEVMGEASRSIAMYYLMEVEERADEWPEAEPFTYVTKERVEKIKRPHSIAKRVAKILSDIRSKGDKVDPRHRWNQIDDVIKRPVVDSLGEMPEATLDDVPFAIASDYANRDADATLRIAPVLEAEIRRLGLQGVSQIDHDIIPMVDRMAEVGLGLAPREQWDELEAECISRMNIAQAKIKQKTKLLINPDSGDQVAYLLYDHLHIPITKSTKSEARGATDDKTLQQISTHLDVVALVQDYREASKVKSSFVLPLRSIVLRSDRLVDARVHCTIRITRVSSGRLAATNPNLLAIPVRTDFGKEVRRRFVAPDGRILGDWDLDQIEMRYMADESGDETLRGIFNDGKVDIHTSTAASMFSVPYSSVTTSQRYAAKRVGFGVITGITGKGLLIQMALAGAKRDDGEDWTETDCNLMIAAWFDRYTGVKRYMQECKDEAFRWGFVRDRWGRRRYLPGIWSSIGRVREEAGRQAHSFKISAGAQGYMKLVMKQIWDYVQYIWKREGRVGIVDPLLQIHDSLLFELDDREDLKEELGMVVPQFMRESVNCFPTEYYPAPIKPITIPVGGKGGFGYTWADVK